MTSIARLLLRLLMPLAFVTQTAAAEDAGPERPVGVGYVELEEDSRYRHASAYTGIAIRTLGRPYPGAELGLADARRVGRFAGVDFALERARGRSPDTLAVTVRRWIDDGVHFVLADLPAEALIRLADLLAGEPVLLFNVSAPDDRLRGRDCRANIVHVHPSRSMLTDALAQYLAAKTWREVLLLHGPTEADAALAEAMRRSAAKFGLEIVAERDFVLSNDPRQRNRNNVALATAGIDYDVVMVADTDGEFDRYVPHQVALPRPVVGTEGLVPRAWHWSWHRHGAPQVQHRFEERAMPRRMNDPAWSAWVAMKAVTQAALRAERREFAPMRDYLLSQAMNLDGAKGNPMSVRPWDRQLRQPLLLARENAVIARAPLPEFRHRTNVLDTLGPDAGESACALAPPG